MHIFYNGRFLTQRLTGVQRYSHVVLKSWDRLFTQSPEWRQRIKVTVLAPKADHLYQPEWAHIGLRRVGRLGGQAWEQLELPAHVDGPLFCPGNTAPVATLLSGRPVIVTVHDLSSYYHPSAYDWRFRAVYRALMPFVFAHARAVVTVSHSEKDAMTRYFPQAKDRIVPILPGSFSSEMLAQIPEIPACEMGRPYMLYVGSLTRRKNVQGVLAAAQELVRERDVAMYFVGDVSRSFIAPDLAAPGDLRDHISFLGRIEDRELISWYKGASCFVFPSFYESFGSPTVEAMSCGCPVIASDIPALREICGDAAVFCEADSTASIVAAMRRLTGEVSFRAEMSARARARAQRFSWDDCALTLLETIEAKCKA